MNLSKERAGLIAYEIGAAIIDVVENDEEINAENIVAYLEIKQKIAGGWGHKSIYIDAIDLVMGHRVLGKANA